MSDNKRVPGNTTVSPDVIETIIRQTANDIKGINRIYSNSSNPGIKIKINESTVDAEIFIVINAREKVLDVCRELQFQTARAISEMIGMEVGELNVHVEDYQYPEDGN